LTTPLLLATSNPGKIEAFRRLLADLHLEITLPDDLGLTLDVDETGVTFAENALIKARAYRDASGIDSLADDSGLCVDALDGEPGVHSARFGGYQHSPTAQNLLLLERLRDVSPDLRGASFVSVIAFAGSDGHEWTAEGVVRGQITKMIRGWHGFGYDPVFLLPELGKTYAELAPAVKDPISHRGRAMEAARSHIRRDLALLE